MCCEHLVCASCAHTVADGHCPVCRAARDRMHHSGAVPATTYLVLIVALLAIAAVISGHVGL